MSLLWPSPEGAPLKETGVPLNPSVRWFMESRFGLALDDVRVHTCPQAHAAAQTLNARAFTVGKDIFFAEGEYAPQSARGLRLLAHELVHVVQQRGTSLGAHRGRIAIGAT